MPCYRSGPHQLCQYCCNSLRCSRGHRQGNQVMSEHFKALVALVVYSWATAVAWAGH